MKTFVIFTLAVVVSVASARPQEKYTIKYDGIDLDELLKNERLLKSYYNCLIGKVTCSTDGQELKNILPDALKTECSKCSEKQKEGAKKIINFLIENKSDWWETLEAEYDKEGVYRKKYKDIAEKEGVKLTA